MLADRVNDTTTHFLVLTPYKALDLLDLPDRKPFCLAVARRVHHENDRVNDKATHFMVLTPYMDRLKKEYVQELLLLLSDWKATLRFSPGVSSWKLYGWANRSSVYIPYLFCQLCSGSSVRPLWGARMAQGMSTRLPSKWPGFKSRHQYHMWVGFVVGSLPSSERLFPG